MPDRPIQGHYSSHRRVDLLGRFFLIHLNIAGRVLADVDIIHVPPEDRMTAVGDPLFKDELHQLLRGRAHVLIALPEGDNRKAHAFKVLGHLGSTPAVEGDL